ncbi:uncharacterized protein LOC131525809 [Onychostoma macrolepis]|uniref:Immunoglobulin domain-containing protein n=1 Tax=Onychostoma macrolepis TaxID=369639 RepID=A0A7J6C2M6_9TELE|nr:uncharacterized protein LOC131525809 [Onychostoma macrolepis]KAF4101003.1 hypothetical protein G5714_019199 [Onychostoma macrolepis]
MEKVIFFFCVFSYWITQITSNDASVRGSSDPLRVQMEESISLNCSMTNQYEIAWYHLRSEQLDQLIAAEKDETGRKLLVTYNQNSIRLKITADWRITTVTLIISGVTASDSGLYFCGTKSGTTEMYFNKPFRLEIEGLSVTEEPKEVDITDGVTTKERALMFGGVGLAVFVFFLATVIAGGIIHYRSWQKGWAAAKRSSLINHKSVK